MRQFGASTEEGRRFLVLDEAGKHPRLASLLKLVYQLGSTVSYRRLYKDASVTVPFRSAVYFPCVSFPDWLAQSGEFSRRCRLHRLFRTTPNWSTTCGGDSAAWRDRSADNARVANSLLTHAYRLCCGKDFIFDDVADELGASRFDAGDAGMSPELLRALYLHCRGELGTRVLFEDNGTFAKGWVDLTAPDAKRLVDQIVDADDGDGDLRRARTIAQKNLKAVDWGTTLGIESVPIAIEVKIHGSRWGCRFRDGRPALRGYAVLNEDLPPLPEPLKPGASSTPATRATVAAPTAPTAPSASTAQAATVGDEDAAVAALREGGLL